MFFAILLFQFPHHAIDGQCVMINRTGKIFRVSGIYGELFIVINVGPVDAPLFVLGRIPKLLHRRCQFADEHRFRRCIDANVGAFAKLLRGIVFPIITDDGSTGEE